MSDVERADWMEIVTELRERAEAAEEQARVLGEALSEANERASLALGFDATWDAIHAIRDRAEAAEQRAHSLTEALGATLREADEEIRAAEYEYLHNVTNAPDRWKATTLMHRSTVDSIYARSNRLAGYLRRVSAALAASVASEPPRCICARFTDLPEGTIIADLTCPIHGVDGTDPGDVLPAASSPDAREKRDP